MESTIEQPVVFFESFILNGGLELFKENYIQDILSNSGYYFTGIDNSVRVITFLDVDKKGNTIEQSYS